MPKTTFAGHPLHAQLISLPVAMLPASFAFDLLYRSTRRTSFADAAWYTMLAGYGGALAAATAGAGDYLAIKGGTHTKRLATLHGLMNGAVVGLYGLNLATRRRDRAPSAIGIALSAIGTAGVMVSAWYGGHLVYEHGVRVRGKDDLEGARELRLPLDHQLEDLFTRIEEAAGEAAETGAGDAAERAGGQRGTAA